YRALPERGVPTGTTDDAREAHIRRSRPCQRGAGGSRVRDRRQLAPNHRRGSDRDPGRRPPLGGESRARPLPPSEGDAAVLRHSPGDAGARRVAGTGLVRGEAGAARPPVGYEVRCLLPLSLLCASPVLVLIRPFAALV